MQDVAAGWVAGLRHHGQNVRVFPTGDRVEYHGKAMQASGQFDHLTPVEYGQLAARLGSEGVLAWSMVWWPEVIIIVSCFFVPADMLDVLRGRGIKVVVVLTESPYEDDNQLRMAAHGDLVLINDPTNLEQFREINPNTHYQPHGWNPEVHKPGPVDADAVSDFCFVGTGYPSRVAFLESVDWSGIDFALAGNWIGLDDDSPLRKFIAHDIDQCIDNTEAVRLYSNTAASLNLYRVEALDADVDGWSMGPRELELAAMGVFFLRQSRPESDQVLPMLPTIDSPEDFGDKLRWWLAHPAERLATARAAREAIEDRSYHHHAAALLRRLT